MGGNMDVTVTVPGSCGELIQGYRQGEPFLVTLPINRYASARIVDDGMGARPAGWKGKAAVNTALAHWGRKIFPYSVYTASELPEGKGMASSSAEIGAIFAAIAVVLDISVSEQELAYMAASIEPTDGVFCAGWCCLNYMTGKLWHTYRPLPFHIAVIDTGGMVDTIRFHEAEPLPMDMPQSIWQDLREPWDYARAGRAATASAMRHQQIMHKPQLAELWHAAKDIGALGINAAHSGTVIGVLFPASRAIEEIGLAVRHMIACLDYPGTYMDTVATVSGGYAIRWNNG